MFGRIVVDGDLAEFAAGLVDALPVGRKHRLEFLDGLGVGIADVRHFLGVGLQVVETLVVPFPDELPAVRPAGAAVLCLRDGVGLRPLLGRLEQRPEAVALEPLGQVDAGVVDERGRDVQQFDEFVVGAAAVDRYGRILRALARR